MGRFDKETNRNTFFEKRDQELSKLTNSTTGKVRAELVEEVTCPLCEENNYSKLFVKNGFDFVRCNKCTMVYINPQMKEGEIIKYYDEKSKTHDAGLAMMTSSKQEEIDTKLYNEMYDEIEKNGITGKNVLDIGCSTGLFLKVGKDRGYTVQGMELNEDAANIAEQKRGVPVEHKLLHEVAYPDNTFDIISMFGVIEHLPRPVAVMKEVYRILKPGGVFLGKCPNVQSAVCMSMHELSRTFTGRVHLNYFSPKTVKELFTRAGFNESEIHTIYNGLPSILNYMQYLDPFSDDTDEFLPEKLRTFLKDDKNNEIIEAMMKKFDIALKLEFFAYKK